MKFRNLYPSLGLLTCFSWLPLVAQTGDSEMDQWVFPEYSWKEEDFQNRFLGRYGVNGYTEPQMDVENYNTYEGVMALMEDRKQAILYLQNSILVLDESGIQASAALHFVLASLFYEEGEMQSAIEQYILAIRKHPSFLRAYANLGFTLMEVGESEKALPVLLKTVELGANESQIDGLIGRIYVEKQLYESGLTAFRNAMVFNPENNAWRFGILQCLIGLGRYEEAITMVDEAIAFDRRNPDHWKNRANLLLELERWDEAIVDLQVADSLGDATFATRHQLATLLFNKEIYGQASEWIARAGLLADDFDSFDRLLTLAQSLSEVGLLAETVALLPDIESRAAGLGIALDRSKIDRIRVALEFENGNHQEALSLVDALIEENPADGGLQLQRAQVLISLGREEEAILSYQIAATQKETTYVAHYENARLRLARGEIAEALALLRKAYTENPSESLRTQILTLEAYVFTQ